MHHYVNPQKIERQSLSVHLSGLIFIAAIIWNFYWIVDKANFSTVFSTVFSIVFAIAVFGISIAGILSVLNNWHYKSIKPIKLNRAEKPMVAVIVPTCGEPIDVVISTIDSIANQDWPRDRRVIILSDDSHNLDLFKTFDNYRKDNNESGLVYFNPHHVGHPFRDGEAKAGNLNAALRFVIDRFPHVEYVETRDADDLLGTNSFLSYCVGHLVRNPDVSFVQTIKECLVHPDDPFSNNESVFYKMTMQSRNAVNAAFPCGSGLVWRMSELKRLEGFPVWNLVEDLQSGIEILRRGGKGAYLPIVGAIAQVAPEDIPNFYKQRGTWAIDSLRLFFWKNPFFTSGLNLWQKLQFFELEFSYLLSFSMAIFIISLILNLVFNIYPVIDTSIDSLIHLVGFAWTMELFNIARARGISYKEQSRARQAWLGLMPSFIISTFSALLHGPDKKPSYSVTRKYHRVSWYWRETFIHKAIILSLSLSIIYSAIFHWQLIFVNTAAIFWSLFFIYGFSQMVKNSWHGLDAREEVVNFVNEKIVKKAVEIGNTAVL